MSLDEPMKLVDATDRLILKHLLNGRDTAANMAHPDGGGIGVSGNYINKRLNELREYRLVETVGADGVGLYQVTERGVATYLLFDEYERGREFEERVDAYAEGIEIRPFGYIDHNVESAPESGEE